VQNVTIQNTGTPGFTHGFTAQAGGTLNTNHTVSNAIAGAVFLANNDGIIFPGIHTFSGSCYYLWWSTVNSITKPGAAYTFSTAIAVTGAVAAASQGGQVDMGFTVGLGPTFTNPSFVSGPKYSATLNGVVVAASLGGVGNIPGSSPGSTSTGGQVF
jgi:hypothetical protein